MLSGSRTLHSCLNDAKTEKEKKSVRLFSRKLRVKFQGVKIKPRQMKTIFSVVESYDRKTRLRPPPRVSGYF